MTSPTVCSLQPFYGGSHRQFIEGWQKTSRLNWVSSTLPDRHWKWRMRHAAIEFSQRVDQLWTSGNTCDAIFTTDMLNVAEFKGLLKSAACNCPVVLYFHENQLEYPNQHERERDFHFGFTNFTSCLAADAVWFNSRYNLDSFVGHLRKLMKFWPDFQPKSSIDDLLEKSSVFPPGIAWRLDEFKRAARKPDEPLHLLWAARWEHDKNPDDLLAIFKRLVELKVDFKASVIGQQYQHIPPAFDRIKQLLGNRIVHWGYLESEASYNDALAEADVFLSTALHEFFGIAAAEAIGSGCFPLLPNRLAYPELVNLKHSPNHMQFLYDSIGEAVATIDGLATGKIGLSEADELSCFLRETSCWTKRAATMDDEIAAICNRM